MYAKAFRRVTVVMFIGLLGIVVGCGKSKPTEAEPTPNPGPQPGPGPADPHELDPAKHTIPTTPVGGRLGGSPFTPDRVELEGTRLKFRSGKDFFADQEVALSLSNSAKLAEGYKVTVRPEDAWSGITPMVQLSAKQGQGGLPDMQHPEKYALTLELGKTEKGKVPGKIYLCVPDAQKSYLAGTFVAERKRSMWDPPGDDEVPFIHGSVSPPVKAKEFVHVGYVGATTDGKTVSDLAGMVVNGEESQAICSRTHAPRQAALQIEKFVPRFDFSNLPPGRYLIFARVKDGPAAWSWVEVAAGAKVPADLKLDAAKLGSVEVKLAGGGGHPRLAPADLGPAPLPADFLGQLEFSLDFNPVTKDGVVTFASVPAGKYRVRDGTLTADIEVTASKTATVELKPGKK